MLRRADGKANIEELKRLMSAERLNIRRTIKFDREFVPAPESATKPWREVAAYYIADWATDSRVPFNRSLSQAATGRYMKSIKGSVLIEAATYDYDDDRDKWDRGHAGHDTNVLSSASRPLAEPSDREAGFTVSDAVPGDINRILHYFNVKELKHPQPRTPNLGI